MKRLIVLSVILAVTLLVGNHFSHVNAQDPVNEEKPTFYRLIPGVYVNGWPRFIVTYPKDWVELHPNLFDAFRVSAPGSVPYPAFMVVTVQTYLTPLDKMADALTQPFKAMGFTDVVLVSDKPSQLRDGTPAREIEFKFIMMGAPRSWVALDTKKGDLLVQVHVSWPGGETGEHLKAMLYSLEFQPGKDEPVKVPPNVQEFLDRWCSDIVSHDVAKVMTHYSDRFLNSGNKKGEYERLWRQFIGTWISAKWIITDFVPAVDRAYLTGFVTTNFGAWPIIETSIIKENGEWKWYGNQREIAR